MSYSYIVCQLMMSFEIGVFSLRESIQKILYTTKLSNSGGLLKMYL